MSVLNSARLGAVVAQTVIDGVESLGQDVDTVTLRLNIVSLLQIHAEDLEPDDDEHELLDAYREWLRVAVDFYGTEPQADAAEYIRAAGRLETEATLVVLGRG